MSVQAMPAHLLRSRSPDARAKSPMCHYWQAQLEALNTEARSRSNVSFVALDADTQRDIIRQQIADDRIDRLPRPYRARHVAVALLAYFYSTPEATDLCYQAAIGKNNCRPLRRSPDKPISLEREG